MDRKTPGSEYQRRLSQRCAEVERLERIDRWTGDARLVVFGAAVLLAWPTLASQIWSPVWLLAPVAVFAVLAVFHGRTAAALERRRRGVDFYQRGLARVSGDRSKPLTTGTEFEPREHPYARDLDLFGEGSLYALLATAHSLEGRRCLACWLLGGADREILESRQEAVRELGDRLELREELAELAADLDPKLTAEALSEWGGGPTRLKGWTWPAIAVAVAAVNYACLGAWLFGPVSGRWLLVTLGLSALFATTVRTRVAGVLESLRFPAGELRFVARLLGRLESEPFESERVAELTRSIAGESPSEGLARLARLVEWNDSRGNQFFQPFALLGLVGSQIAFAVERWRERDGDVVGDWLRAVGEFEALSALATFHFENPDYPFPVFVEGEAHFEGDGLVHPLLPHERRVPNDVVLSGGDGSRVPSLLLVSGSNMSGKSTLLRTVGVVAVLAYAGAPVPARALRLSLLAIGASLEVHDSLVDGVSRFYAELTRLAVVRELAESGPTLYLLDEILHGTNSHDRRLGAAGVVRSLISAGAIGLVTTHDLALSDIAEELDSRAANVHFEDHLEDGRMAFDYTLREGVVERGNALALMRSLGLPVADETA